jgi:hypothetical protein
MVIWIGFEPMACCLEGSCSIQLSYQTLTAAKVKNTRMVAKPKTAW